MKTLLEDSGHIKVQGFEEVRSAARMIFAELPGCAQRGFPNIANPAICPDSVVPALRSATNT
ncbi:MAG: hypothetical protein K2Q97_13645 [Burkholderiaceae bacterium]|nr:hypothetical protein [Burkholderiaceae bacterium]